MGCSQVSERVRIRVGFVGLPHVQTKAANAAMVGKSRREPVYALASQMPSRWPA
jgi:hypothetical protein